MQKLQQLQQKNIRNNRIFLPSKHFVIKNDMLQKKDKQKHQPNNNYTIHDINNKHKKMQQRNVACCALTLHVCFLSYTQTHTHTLIFIDTLTHLLLSLLHTNEKGNKEVWFGF